MINDKVVSLILTSASSVMEDEYSIYLGSWCFNGKYFQDDKNEINVLPFHWRNADELEAAIHYTEHLYEEMLPQLADFLNRYHGVDYSEDYWRIVTGKFFNYYINILYDRYVCLTKAFEQLPAISVKTMPDSLFVYSEKYTDFLMKSTSDDYYNYQLFSQLVRCLRYNDEPDRNMQILRNNRNESLKNRQSISDYSIRSIIKKPVLEARRKYYQSGITASIVLINTNIPKNKSIYLTLRSGMKIREVHPMKNEPVNDIKIDTDARKKISNMTGPDEFGAIVWKTLQYNMPICYLEGYKGQYKALLNKMKKGRRPKIIVVGYTPNDVMTLSWIAKCKEQGTKIVGVQHGGAYGEFKYDSRENFERKISHEYVTWGWKDTNDDVPLPALKLINIKKKNVNCSNSILWVATESSKYCNIPWNTMYYPLQRDYLSRQKRFYKAVEDKFKNLFILRLKNVKANQMNRYWMEEYPELKLDDNTIGFTDRLLACRLIIFDHFGGTTFLEALTLNKPVIAFSQSQYTLLRDSARPYYNKLYETGILHDEPEDAARYLNLVIDDVDGWWNEPRRGEAVRMFRDNFAYVTQDGIDRWKEFLLNKLRIDRE